MDNCYNELRGCRTVADIVAEDAADHLTHPDYCRVSFPRPTSSQLVSAQIADIEKVADFLDQLPEMMSKETIQKVIIDAMIRKVYYSNEIMLDHFEVADLIELFKVHLAEGEPS